MMKLTTKSIFCFYFAVYQKAFQHDENFTQSFI